MPARSAADVLSRLQSNPPNLWVDGKQVSDPTADRHTANACRSLAALYDLQLHGAKDYFAGAGTRRPQAV